MQNDKPAISVIVPFFNIDKSVVEKCIKSILSQTFSDFELLIVNDGSDSNYSEELNSLAVLDDRIIVLNKQNGGVSTARNLGTEMARGAYIAYVDADDIVCPWYLDQAYTVCMNNNLDYVIGSTKEILIEEDSLIEAEKLYKLPTTNKDNIIISKYASGTFETIIPSLISSDKILRFTNGGYINRGPVARLIKTDIAKQVEFPRGLPIGEDVIWNQYILKKCTTVGIVENIWYIYLKRKTSASYTYRENAIEIVKMEGTLLYKAINPKNDDIYVSFCNKLLADTRLIICGSYLSNKNNKTCFLKKYRLFNSLKTHEPWTYISHRYIEKCEKKQRLIFYLFRYNLLFPILFVKNHIARQ